MVLILITCPYLSTQRTQTFLGTPKGKMHLKKETRKKFGDLVGLRIREFPSQASFWINVTPPMGRLGEYLMASQRTPPTYPPGHVPPPEISA